MVSARTWRWRGGSAREHLDDLLLLQPCLGFPGAGQHGGWLGDLADGQLGRVQGMAEERPVGDRIDLGPGGT